MSCDLGWDHAPPEGCQRAWGHVLERVELLWVISTPSVNSMTKDSPTVLRILFVNWIWVNDHPRKAGEFDCTARRAMIHKFMLILWSCVDTLETLSYFAVCSGRSNPSTMFFTQKMYSRLKYDWVCLCMCVSCMHVFPGPVRVFYRHTVRAPLPRHLLPNSVAHSRPLYIAVPEHTNIEQHQPPHHLRVNKHIWIRYLRKPL